MAGSLTNYAETALAKHFSKETAFSPAATLYLALCTAEPGEAATGASMSEVANSGSYARTAITFAAASSRRVTQTGAVTFPTLSGSLSTATHWAVVDSSTYGSGNVLAYGAFAVGKSLVSGNTPSCASGEVWVEITASTGLTNYGANGFLDRMFRNQAFTIAATYIGLATATLSDSTTSPTEVSTSSTAYARKLVNVTGGASPAWNAVASGAFDNTQAITFADATASWGTVTSAFVADASSAGNILWYDNSITDQLVGIGDTVSFAAGAFDFSQA